MMALNEELSTSRMFTVKRLAPRQPTPVKALANKIAWEMITTTDWKESNSWRGGVFHDLSFHITTMSLQLNLLDLAYSGYTFQPKVLEIVIMAPSHLKLCLQHFKDHQEQELNRDSSNHYFTGGDYLCSGKPFGKCNMRFSDFSELYLGKRGSSCYAPCTIRWEVFHISHFEKGCDYFNLHYLLQFHGLFDKSDKYEMRKAWLLRGKIPHEVL